MGRKKTGQGLFFSDKKAVEPKDDANAKVIADNAKIVGNTGSSYLEINLSQGQKIHAASGSMLFLTGDISMPENKFDGFGKIFAGEHIVHQEYTGTGSKPGKVAFGLDFPNDIIRIPIQPGVKYRFSRYSYLASTTNVKVSWTTQWKGIFGIGQSEGFVLPTVENVGNSIGYVWLCAYGTFEVKKILEGETIIVDNGLFLACDNRNQYDVVKVGRSLFASLINKEGFAMKFNGPCYIYLQSKNLDGFINMIASQMPVRDGGNQIDIGEVAELFEGGKAKRKYVRKNKSK
jgi:uncharacterized protein (AIM24 family)